MGAFAGGDNTTGDSNTFAGANAGRFNTTGRCQCVLWCNAGGLNTTGSQNTFFGAQAGNVNTTGVNNAFFGIVAGTGNTTGGQNVFFGVLAGKTNTTGNNNTALGAEADVASGNLSFATAVGAGAVVSTSNTVVLGRAADTVFAQGKLRIGALGNAGSTQLCLNASGEVSGCSSSINYKTNINSFNAGLNLIKQLHPVSFNWRADNKLDVGLVAEEVGAAEPLLVTKNDKGTIEGVKYDRVGVVLVNAVKEQQQQIETQQKQIDEQKETIKRQQEQLEKEKKELDALKLLVCSQNPTAQLCQPEK